MLHFTSMYRFLIVSAQLALPGCPQADCTATRSELACCLTRMTELQVSDESKTDHGHRHARTCLGKGVGLLLTTLSISSVVTPGRMAACPLSRISRAILQALRRPAICFAVRTGAAITTPRLGFWCNVLALQLPCTEEYHHSLSEP